MWDNGKFDKYIKRYWEQQPFTVLFIDGNHENFNLLNSYPVENWNGGKIHRIGENIIHLMRGQVFKINGKTFFTMGGATSQDKHLRKENISWWAQEMPSKEEMEEGLNNLQKHNNSVDYIITHSLPSCYLCYFGYEPDSLTSYFNYIQKYVDFKKWYSGHYHRDKIIDKNMNLIYQDIIEL